MIRQIRAPLVAFTLLTLMTGVLYPFLITGVGQVFFPTQANGTLIVRDGEVVGSSLIGQTTDDPAYFWWRPSAVNALQSSTPNTLIASGASNLSWTNASLLELVEARAAVIREANHLAEDAQIPPDLLFASGSGLDPHISPEAALFQVERVALERGLERAQVEALVAQFTEQPQLGILGQPRVNVLLLNLALDRVQ